MAYSWKASCFKACMLEADNKLEFTNQNLIKNQLPTIIDETKTKGKTPANTLSYILQRFRDVGLVKFISAGYYALIPQKIDLSSLKKKASQGEKMIFTILKELNIDFVREKSFKNLKDKGFLRFDFYFEINSISFAIEFDGEQHRKPIEYFGGKEAFENLKKRDIMKDEYCKDNNIHLIRINELNKKKATIKIIKDIIRYTKPKIIEQIEQLLKFENIKHFI